MDCREKNVFKDLIILGGSIIVAVYLAKSGLLEKAILRLDGLSMMASFISGIFFVSVFTVAPAGVFLFDLAKSNNIFLVAFFGALGAVFGDFVIFKFVKDSLCDDIGYFFGLLKEGKYKEIISSSIFRKNFFRRLMPIFGAIIVASPFPDEIGLAMMGLSKMKTRYFLPLVFLLNFIGILIIVYFA